MLFLHPTEFGAGVTLWGDAYDLEHLYDTIHAIDNDQILGSGVSDFLLGLAYDIRHAYQDERLVKLFDSNHPEKIHYKGVQILWPIFLVQVSLLRHAASYHPTTRAQQADLYRLEAITEKALFDYEPVTGKECMELLPLMGALPKDYLVEFISVASKEYVLEGKTGKPRFRKLPKILRKIWWMSDEYKVFKAELEKLAQEKGCRPEELTTMDDWEDFKW
jgi:hypothetical protein